jgi:hypothetical protein
MAPAMLSGAPLANAVSALFSSMDDRSGARSRS